MSKPSQGLVLCLAVLVGLSVASGAWAHDLGVARATIHEVGAGEYRVQVKLPENIDADAPVFPPRCTVNHTSSIPLPEKNRLDNWHVVCDGPAIPDQIIHFPWPREGVAVRALWLDGSEASMYVHATGGSAGVALEELHNSTRTLAEAAVHYLALGVEHILLGWDHLAFVLALCLIATGWERVKLVTVFTLGHSITLALATLDWLRLPSPPVEACIALSVVYLAREAWFAHTRGTGRSMVVVLIFGLLHGLGFAGALAESGIRDGEFLVGLFSFNLGVELGQMLFVLLIVGLTSLVRQIANPMLLRQPAAFAVGALGMFWVIDRVALIVA